MARDKSKDDKYFNCSQQHERDYVANLYGEDAPEVADFLERKCSDGTIKYSTHIEVYELIRDELGFPIPD